MPRLCGAAPGEANIADNGLLTARWRMADGTTLRLIANLSDQDIAVQETLAGAPIWGGEAGGRLLPWSVFWRIGG
jgi:maltooligosyltrehalose trehalohydrolase